MPTPERTVSTVEENEAGTAMERSNLYGFLATIFRREPSAALLREVKEPAFRAALSAAGIALDEGFLTLPEAELLDELAMEYTRLFVGPGPHVSPHASVHVERDGGALCGKATFELKHFIEAAGFDYEPDYQGLPDHVSVALEFLARLARTEAEALETGSSGEALRCLECEQDFVVDHLAPWLPAFCEKVSEAATLPFYRDMARLTADFIEAERKMIAQRLDTAVQDGQR